ncbi:MAG: general secretion pathway protein GspB [Elusimicrobia bacterium]|nr:general secretion pathway protein GspB [Elusimicrobiota bacterium]
MSSRNLLTWLIPLAALVIPGFLFYNWWSTLNQQSRRDLERKVKSNAGLAVFMGNSGKNNLKNPLSDAAAPAVAASTEAASGGAVPGSNAAQAAVATAVSSSTAAAGPGAQGPQGAAGPDASQTVASASPVAGVVITRDPTLSPYDLVRLEQMRLEAEIRKGEISDAVRRPVKKPKEPPIENSIDLQGIVAVGAGNKAIINGEMVGEGELVLGKAKVVRITPQAVVFTYKGRRFSKSISK